jgi:hypothetical protein
MSNTPVLVSTRRVVIVLAVLIAGPFIAYGAFMVFFAHAITQSDPYPTFMADYEPRGSRTYDEVIRRFPVFVAERFPIGSDMSDAVAQITKGGFRVASSTSTSVKLVWNRHNGPCGEEYSIVISGDASGKIAEIAGRLHPICL